MTWQELKEEAKKIGYEINNGFTRKCEWVTSPDGKWDFVDDGTVIHDNYVVSFDRIPDQMLAIMKALQ